MKHILTLLIFSTLFVASTQGQGKQKFAHIDSQKLLDAMPERSAAEKELQAYASQLEAQLQSMMNEFESKLADYQSNESVMSDVIRQSKTEELESLNQRIQSFQQKAQKSIVQKENELVQPILEKAKKAIEEVAKKNGYTYVFDTSSGALLYQPEGDDILQLVMDYMGITAQPESTSGQTGQPQGTPAE